MDCREGRGTWKGALSLLVKRYGVGGVVAYCIIMTDPYTGLGVWGFGYSGPGLDKNHISGLK